MAVMRPGAAGGLPIFALAGICYVRSRFDRRCVRNEGRNLPRPGYFTLLGRALRLRCPRCGRGRLFSGWFHMLAKCDACGLGFEREPGFYLGSIYVNYGMTSILTTAAYVVLWLGFDVAPRSLLFGLTPFCVVFPMFFFRYARAMWLALDCRLDPATFRDDVTSSR